MAFLNPPYPEHLKVWGESVWPTNCYLVRANVEIMGTPLIATINTSNRVLIGSCSGDIGSVCGTNEPHFRHSNLH
jgi:hypothetical protein